MGGLEAGMEPRVVFLVLLGLVLLVHLFRRYRGRLNTALQHAAIWVLIFLAGIVVYAFKDTITAELMPGQVRSAGPGRIEVSRAGDGHFYIDGAVNGVEVTFLVDTGASELVLARSDAARAGIDPGALTYLGSARTANGIVATAGVRLDRVALGPFVERDVPARVTDGDLDISLLGMSYLDRFAGFSVTGDRLVIER